MQTGDGRAYGCGQIGAEFDERVVPQWAEVDLPDSWVDLLIASGVWSSLKFILSIPFAPPRRVSLPSGMPGADTIPPYALQAFHNLPNGNYSKHLSRGYITGFDRVMLNETGKLRNRLADNFRGCSSVLDPGCGGGKLAAALSAAGVRRVYGLDPSPYLLQHAAKSYPNIRFSQGIIENLKFDNNSLEGVAAFFLFHEIPPKYVRQGMDEIFRVLKPGAKFAFCEPSRIQYTAAYRDVIRGFGWKGIYFKLLATSIYEPFIDAWHKENVPELLANAGFELLQVEESMPASYYVFRKPGQARVGARPLDPPGPD